MFLLITCFKAIFLRPKVSQSYPIKIPTYKIKITEPECVILLQNYSLSMQNKLRYNVILMQNNSLYLQRVVSHNSPPLPVLPFWNSFTIHWNRAGHVCLCLCLFVFVFVFVFVCVCGHVCCKIVIEQPSGAVTISLDPMMH